MKSCSDGVGKVPDKHDKQDSFHSKFSSSGIHFLFFPLFFFSIFLSLFIPSSRLQVFIFFFFPLFLFHFLFTFHSKFSSSGIHFLFSPLFFFSIFLSLFLVILFFPSLLYLSLFPFYILTKEFLSKLSDSQW